MDCARGVHFWWRAGLRVSVCQYYLHMEEAIALAPVAEVECRWRLLIQLAASSLSQIVGTTFDYLSIPIRLGN